MNSLLLLVFSLAPAALAADKRPAGPRCIEGKEAASVRALKAAVKADPGSGAKLVSLAHCRARAGDQAGARADLRKAAQSRRKDRGDMLLQALLTKERAIVTHSRQVLDQALQRDLAAVAIEGLEGKEGPEADQQRAALRGVLASSKLLTQRERVILLRAIEGARAFARLVVEARPDFVPGQSALAAIEESQGSLSSALEAADRAVALAPKDFWVHLNRGTLLARMGREVEALEELDRTMPLATAENEALVLTARWPVLRALKIYDRLREDLDRTIEKKPFEPDAYVVRAYENAREKKWRAAAEDWLEGRRLWLHLYGDALLPRAGEEAVALIAKVMEAGAARGLDPGLAATMVLEGYVTPE